jgi:endonuclease/exonuclease/phosphatase family metal-dependent hydrolase
MGDFNEVLRQEEHEGVGQRTKAHMDGFRDAVDVCGLQDLGYVGRAWTFEERVVRGSFCRVCLDRALATPDWSALYPTATLKHLTAATSDHGPILLELDDATRTRPSGVG